jgi:tetratricopeptide (TPR) repeat protein
VNKLKPSLESANKLIFVKKYPEAKKIFEEILGKKDYSQNLLIHLRRIELYVMLNNLESLRLEYIEQLKHPDTQNDAKICLAFIDQQSENVNHNQMTTNFQNLLKECGPSAAIYFGIGYSMEYLKNNDRAIFNYEQALKEDPLWYVANFGLSQIYYQMGDEKKGDHFFYLFEQAAPYNVYGNFETHRKLSREFLELEMYEEAEIAVQALSQWWQENKGSCPAEIKIYEFLATARIAELQKNMDLVEIRRTKAVAICQQLLEDSQVSENVYYFVAKILEEHGHFTNALDFYKKILKSDRGTPAMVQKIGGQFLSHGEYALAKEIFQEAYDLHPENNDLKFCLLVTNLKLSNANVEEYLIGRERLRQLVENSGDKVELLSLLHNLLAKFNQDSEVHLQLAEAYLKMGNSERASKHFETMYRLDPKNYKTSLRYSAYLMQYKSPDMAISIIKNLETNHPQLPSDAQVEADWLKANYYARRKEYEQSTDLLRRILAVDPWNVSYLIQEIINLTIVLGLDSELKKIDTVFDLISQHDESKINWEQYDAQTEKLEANHAYELVYVRRKLRYLYGNGSETLLFELIKSACKFNAVRATYDFMRLLNTNFDSYNIYWALGILFKELWQLETAAVFFEQMLLHPQATTQAKAKAYLELADCFIWQGKNLPKALEYVKMGMDFDGKNDQRFLRVLAHANLKLGYIRQAKLYLDQIDIVGDHEARYLQGLLHYRNGDRVRANEIWKPLLTVRSESLRFHNIKQEVLKFYFEGAPYLKVN